MLMLIREIVALLGQSKEISFKQQIITSYPPISGLHDYAFYEKKWVFADLCLFFE